MNKKRKETLIGIAVTALTLCLTVVGIAYYLLLAPQFRPAQTVYIHIDRDDTADSIYNKVKQQGHPRNLSSFRWLMRYRHLDRSIHTGRYAIPPGESTYRLYSHLSHGHQAPLNLTIGNVRTLDRLARSLGKQLMVDSAEIAAQLSDTLRLAKMGYTAQTLPALFIPETYQVYWDISVDQLFARMEKEHKRFWNDKRLAQARAMGMTPEEVSTLASIVEEETNNKAERPMVAGLYINRLHAGMPLQADPTVKFALQDFGLRRITNEHLSTRSPYNTYRNAGLPPGPIRIATPQGIDSVLGYTHHNYVYMCAKEDFSGTHNFASNYADHMVNARKYWKALNERNIFK